MVRSKWKLSEIHQLEYGSQRRFVFNVVCADEVPENQRFHKYSPQGRLEIVVDNPNVNYEIGKYYYFDSNPVEAAPVQEA